MKMRGCILAHPLFLLRESVATTGGVFCSCLAFGGGLFVHKRIDMLSLR